MAQIDHYGSEPVWRQLTVLLRAQIEDGTFPPGSFLPSLKTLAETHEVSRQTAFRAVQAIQEAGLARGVPGRGVYVLPVAQRPKPKR